MAEDEPALPLADGAFDRVTSRHPVKAWQEEIARILVPIGTCLFPARGPAGVFELVEYFLAHTARSLSKPASPPETAVAW